MVLVLVVVMQFSRPNEMVRHTYISLISRQGTFSGRIAKELQELPQIRRLTN